MSALPDLFAGQPRPGRNPPPKTADTSWKPLRCACGRWATHGFGVCLRAGQAGTWTCGRAECAPK